MSVQSVGFDLVNIARFCSWHLFSHKALSHFFSAEEIAYSCADVIHSAERFAVRFAIREALYKALAVYAVRPVPFGMVCKSIVVRRCAMRGLQVEVVWPLLAVYYPNIQIVSIRTSVSHAADVAGAVVLLEVENTDLLTKNDVDKSK